MKELLLSIQNCFFSFTKENIFEDISLNVHTSDKIALVGKNGVGKTTIMEIISQSRILDKGETYYKPLINIGYLKQKNNVKFDGKVKDFLLNIEKKTHLNFSQKINEFCTELKVDSNLSFNNLSGGLKRKVFLIYELLKQPDLLLLDEPTNHLDVDSIFWLEEYLCSFFKGAFIIVSHDREFLNKTTKKVFWIDRKKIKISPKGFYNFDEWALEEIEHEKKIIKNKNNLLKQELTWLSKGIKARRKRNIRRKENIIKLEKDLKLKKSDFIKSIARVKFAQNEQSDFGPNILANFFNVTKYYYNNERKINLFLNFNYKLHKGEKIGILGKNGSGKTSFFKLLINQIKPDSGNVKLRKSIEYSYFDQLGDQFNDKKSIKENMIPGGGDYIDVNGKKIHICGYLKNFLFDPSSVNDLVSTISGGQRNRLLLAKVLANPKNLMILDEPTNDLDMDTLDILSDFINEYQGTVLIASHDRDFLDKTTSKIFFFHGNGEIEISNDSCSDLLDKIYKKKVINSSLTKISKKKPISNQKKLNKILVRIEKIEQQIIQLNMTLQLDSELYSKDRNKFDNIVLNIEDLNLELKNLEEQWSLIDESKN